MSSVRAEPNVTPMIDVMLVLLIIFMTVGPMLAAGFPAEPPKGVHLAEHPDQESDAVIGLDRQGRYYFNKRLVSEAALVSALTTHFRGSDDKHVAYLRADKDVLFSRVQDALDIAARAGVRVVGMVSEVPPAQRTP
ncbi:MAG: biopolymer transporter ExbD [Gemmatimonadaceae bacterium]